MTIPNKTYRIHLASGKTIRIKAGRIRLSDGRLIFYRVYENVIGEEEFIEFASFNLNLIEGYQEIINE